ncbi:substrate-binding periplasmic protein [Aliamphritea hakodatensis]|uniref:substrate-binding periplasmic protein n=1 Tax=Aliamphritea hakodatensis TaxID=2895352 RepID=UPI0022FD6EE8|nr:transporter substrate-binding domain-containing protein [Aliamphritea hakodatensis]
MANTARCLLLWVAIVLSVSSVAVTASEKPPLRIIALTDFKPFIWCEQNQADGIDIELIAELFDRLEMTYEIECVPWKRALHYIKTGSADVLLTAYKTADREVFATYPKAPLHRTVFSVFVRKGDGFTLDSVADLSGKRISVPAGFSINPQFDHARQSGQFTSYETNSMASGFQMLMSGRVDAYVNERHVGLYALYEMGMSNEIVPLKTPLHEPRPAYMIFSRKSPLNQKLLIEAVNTHLQDMWNEGTVLEITDSFTSRLLPVAVTE